MSLSGSRGAGEPSAAKENGAAEATGRLYLAKSHPSGFVGERVVGESG